MPTFRNILDFPSYCVLLGRQIIIKQTMTGAYSNENITFTKPGHLSRFDSTLCKLEFGSLIRNLLLRKRTH